MANLLIDELDSGFSFAGIFIKTHFSCLSLYLESNIDMKIHDFLPILAVLLTLLTTGLTAFVRRWSASTLSALLVLSSAFVLAVLDLLVLRIHNLGHLDMGLRGIFAEEILASTAVFLFSILYSREKPAAQFLRMGLPLTVMGLGVFYFVTSFILDNHLFRLLVLPQTHSFLLISTPNLSGASFFLIGILLFSLYQMSRTYISADSLARWNIKYPLIGVSLWSCSMMLVHANQIINSGFDRTFLFLEPVGVILLDGFFLYAFLIQKTQDVALALNRNTINRSLFLLLGGAGLVTLGGVGTTFESLGPVWGKLSTSLTFVLGLGAFVVVFSSDRLRRELEVFLGIHFYSNRYDYRGAWMTLTNAIAESGKPEDIVPTLMVQTREMTMAHALSFGTISEFPSPILHVQETLGWKPDREMRKQHFSPECLSFFSEGLPIHFSDRSSTSKTDEDLISCLNALFKALNANWIVPLVFQKKLLGILGLGIKSQGSMTRLEDRLFLQTLALQWSSLLVNATLARERAGKRESELLSSLRAFTFHDLKNAGVALKLLTHNARRNIESKEFQEELLFSLQNISEQIDSSMEQILSPFQQEYSRVVPFDPAGVIRDTVRSLQWDDNPDLALKVSLSDVQQVQGNPRILETTLRNLLINAREALDGRGEITVETRIEPQFLVLSVADNGPGMSREFIETRLFRPFQTTKKKGTGLGLFSCKLLIEQSGGTISVSSREGEGTEFLITLPFERSG